MSTTISFSLPFDAAALLQPFQLAVVPYLSSHVDTLSSLVSSDASAAADSSVVDRLFSLRAFHSLLFLSLSLWLAFHCLRLALASLTAPCRARPVYLSSFATFDAPKEWNISTDNFRTTSRNYGYTQEAEDFVCKILQRAGIGEQSSFPPGILSNPPDLSLTATKKEAETVIFSCVDQLLAQTGLKPKDIDIIIVNCSLYCPTPSLSAMVVNHYKMRADIQSYNLGGMGCSAGVISLKLARDLLQVYKHANCLVVSTEAITPNIYVGNRKDMLVQNALFRVGGAAMLFTNYKYTPRPIHPTFAVRRPQYELEQCVRCHIGQDDAAFSCVEQIIDEDGNRGVKLSKDLMDVAGRALTKNLTILGPLVLPWSEQLKFGANMLYRRLHAMMNKKSKKVKIDIAQSASPAPSTADSDAAPAKKPSSSDNGPKQYVPKWENAVQHWCIHAGGRGVIDAIQKGLNLSDDAVRPSRHTLHRYGNTSSSSIWYEMQFIEKEGKCKVGDKILQLAFGSGFKCNSAVWRRIR